MLEETLVNYHPTDIKEWHDEFRTVQPHEHKLTHRPAMLWVIHCEICRRVTRRTLYNEDRSNIIASEGVAICPCEQELDDFLNSQE